MALNWDRARRNQMAVEISREKRLAALDPSSYVMVDEEPDSRPRCLVCGRGVSFEGDESRRLSSGSVVHESCLDKDDKQFEVLAEVRFVMKSVVSADDVEQARRLFEAALKSLLDGADESSWELLVSDIDDVV